VCGVRGGVDRLDHPAGIVDQHVQATKFPPGRPSTSPARRRRALAASGMTRVHADRSTPRHQHAAVP
jgi:hypothetical protein